MTIILILHLSSVRIQRNIEPSIVEHRSIIGTITIISYLWSYFTDLSLVKAPPGGGLFMSTAVWMVNHRRSDTVSRDLTRD